MCHRYAIEAVSRTLQDLRKEDDLRRTLPFGGVVVCFCGDFRQTLPIVKKGTRGQIVSATLKSSPLWQNVQVFRLTQNMRLLRPGLTDSQRAEISTFAEQLLQIGERVDTDGMSSWEIHEERRKQSASALAAAVFPNLQNERLSAELLRDSAILAPKNEVVNEINAQLPRIPIDTLSVDAGVEFTRMQFPVKLAFAMTINKAQGQSLSTVGLLLDPEVFSHG